MSITYLGLESWRQLRNVRGFLFTFAIPLMMLLVFGGVFGADGSVDDSTGLPWVVVTTVQMAGYGGMMAALSQSFNIVTERSIGWNRQLRITPLSGVGYMLSKVVTALAVALVSIIALMIISIASFHPVLPASGWVLAALGLWLGVIPFAFIAVLIGQYANPQFAQPLFMIVFFGLSILGGQWIPLQIMPDWMTTVGEFVPSYWLNRLGQMGASGGGDAVVPILILSGWTVALGAVIAWRYGRDAGRA